MNTLENTALPLVDKTCLLEKIPGKGGWTYVALPEIKQDKHAWFGWVKVSGTIDGYEINNYHVMPMGNGSLFLPVNAKIRKVIAKNEGDYVHVVLFSQELPPVKDDDFIICLKDEPLAYEKFYALTKEEQKKITEWIYSVKNDSLKVERIAQTIERLLI